MLTGKTSVVFRTNGGRVFKWKWLRSNWKWAFCEGEIWIACVSAAAQFKRETWFKTTTFVRCEFVTVWRLVLVKSDYVVRGTTPIAYSMCLFYTCCDFSLLFFCFHHKAFMLSLTWMVYTTPVAVQQHQFTNIGCNLVSIILQQFLLNKSLTVT